MNRPDSNPSDSSANQDDAVWLDLVARLEGAPPASTPTTAPAFADLTAGPTPRRNRRILPIANLASGAGPAGPAKRFTDFDPLGLAPTRAPHRIVSRGTGAGCSPAAAPQKAGEPEEPAAPEGPRDYGVEDEDDAFVPEDPPSLSGVRTR